MRIKSNRTWILVADGARAHVVVNDGPGKGLQSLPGSDIRHDLLPTREIGTDRPGRSQESVGGARHAIAPRVDFHQQQKAQFARAIARKLSDHGNHFSISRFNMLSYIIWNFFFS